MNRHPRELGNRDGSAVDGGLLNLAVGHVVRLRSLYTILSYNKT